MDGFELLKLIRENKDTATVPFIFLTAKSERQDTPLGMNLGADDYITKPFSIEELVNAVDARLPKAQKFRKKFRQK